jgi:hypothetical protein
VRGAPLWQKLIWAVLFLVVYEGALRKWVVPELQSQIYFAKDIILIAAYILFLVSGRHHGSHLKAMATLKTLVVLSLAYFLLELLNPDSPSVLVSIVGFKNYLLYAPLAFIVPYMFVSADDLEHKLRTYAILMAPCVALGLVQFAFPPTHWINGYLNNQDSDTPEALMMGAGFASGIAKVRSIGTFSYIGGYTAFLTVMFYVAAGLAAKNRFKFSGNMLIIGYLVLTVAAMFTTGSRGPIWWLIATWPLTLVIWRSGGLLSVGTVGRMLLVAPAVWLLAQFLAADAFDAYAARADQAADTVDRMLAPLIQMQGALYASGAIGTGMGTTNGGALNLMRATDFWWLNGNLFEVEMARVLQETGIVGFVLVYAARVWLLIKAIRLGTRFRNPLYVGLSGAIACLFLQDLMAGFVVNNATVAIYHWFAGGLLFAMYRLEVAESVRTRQGAVHAYGPVAAYANERTKYAVESWRTE